MRRGLERTVCPACGGGLAVLLGAWSVLAAPIDVAWTRLSPPLSPPRRTGHAMVHDASRGEYVLFGGTREEHRYRDTWRFAGGEWAEVVLGEEDSPPALTAHAMVYDASRGRTLLFGGQGGIFDASGELQTVFNAEVYAFEDGRWEQIDVAGQRPAPRAAHAMAYDSRRGLVWLFGGRRGIDTVQMELLGDTWYFDGSVPAWVEVESASGPSPRESSGLVYDASGDRLILFGGGFFGDRRTEETWEFRPEVGQWTLLEPASAPSARQNAARAGVGEGWAVLFGGSRVRSRVDGETWAFDGSSWRQLSPRPAPGGRVAAGLATVCSGGEGLLFGGFTDEAEGDTWALRAVTPTPAPTASPTPTVSPAATETPFPAADYDLNADGRVNGLDLFLLAGEWMATPPGKAEGGALRSDLTGDRAVGTEDLLLLIGGWMERAPAP